MEDNSDARRGFKALEALSTATRKLDQLRLNFLESGFNREDITLRQLSNSIAQKVKIPIIEQEIDSPSAILLIGFFLLGPYFYILSMSSTLFSKIQSANSDDGMDLIFLGSSKVLAMTITFIWFYGPVAVLSTLEVRDQNTFDQWYLQVLYWMLFVLAFVVIASVSYVRRSFYKRLETIEKTPQPLFEFKQLKKKQTNG